MIASNNMEECLGALIKMRKVLVHRALINFKFSVCYFFYGFSIYFYSDCSCLLGYFYSIAVPQMPTNSIHWPKFDDPFSTHLPNFAQLKAQ